MKAPLTVRILSIEKGIIYSLVSVSINGREYQYEINRRDLDKFLWLLNKGWQGKALSFLKKNSILTPSATVL